MRRKRNNQKRERKEPKDVEGHVEGVVIESLPEAMFRIQLDAGETVLGFLAGKMRLHRIRVLVGDKVSVKLDEYGGKARIHKRL